MDFKVDPINAPCGARITGVDLGTELNAATYAAIHQAWLDHQVLVFPDAEMTEEDQIRFT